MGERDRGEQSGGTSAADERGSAKLERITAAWQETSNALRESEHRYRELVEYSLGLICTHDLAGTILSINPAAAHSLGYEPEDGIGRNLRDFVSADTRHLFDDYLRRIQDRGHDEGLMRVVARAGTEKIWMYRNVLSYGAGGTCVLGHAIDVTERISAERTLRYSEQALRAAHGELEARVKERTTALELANERLRVESDEREFLATFSDRLAPLVTFDDLIDVVGRLPVPFLADWTMVHLVEANGSVRFVPGVHADPAQEALLATAAIATSSLDASSDLGAVVARGRLMIFTLSAEHISSRLLGNAGSVSTLERLGARTAAMLPLLIDGRVKAVLSLVSTRPHRFTDTLVLEDVARRIRLALDRIQLYQEAQEANRLKDEFLGMLSHELRTPLNAIFGWARILRTRQLDQNTEHALEVIERNAEAQIRLIEEVLDVSRIIKGKMTLAMEPVDIGTIVRASLDTVRPAMHAKRIRLEDRIEDTPPVLGDSHRLQQVFWNLLSNALKFTASDGSIAVNLRTTAELVEFAITDTGVGIRREVLPFVFDRFRQADSSTTRAFSGLGLGLAIVRHIVELHGGTVWAASAGEGQGATFTLQLPSAVRGHASPRDASLAVESQFMPSPMLHGRTILIVEDHDDARELIATVLQGAGAQVLSASNTQDAIERVTGTPPDLLVADLGLPGEDGYVLLTRIRAMYPQTPAIALTAYARATDRDRALAAGFQQHVIKPIDPRRLLHLITTLL